MIDLRNLLRLLNQMQDEYLVNSLKSFKKLIQDNKKFLTIEEISCIKVFTKGFVNHWNPMVKKIEKQLLFTLI